MVFLLGRGFTGFYHYGHPCFIREDYERANAGRDELQRLEDVLGVTFSDVNTAMYYALTHAKYQLYRLESDEIDQELLCGRDPWTPFHGGYVHIVTGEFVPDSIKPDYDSYPCWKLEEPASRYFNPNSALQWSGALGFLGAVFGALADMMGGKK